MSVEELRALFRSCVRIRARLDRSGSLSRSITSGALLLGWLCSWVKFGGRSRGTGESGSFVRSIVSAFPCRIMRRDRFVEDLAATIDPLLLLSS